MADKKIRTWIMKHPVYGRAYVNAVGFEEATVAAAQYWGAPWAKVAALIEVEREIGKLGNLCRVCGVMFNGRETLCPKCDAELKRKNALIEKNRGLYHRREFYAERRRKGDRA